MRDVGRNGEGVRQETRRERRGRLFGKRTARAPYQLRHPTWEQFRAWNLWQVGGWGTWIEFDYHRLLFELPQPDLRIRCWARGRASYRSIAR